MNKTGIKQIDISITKNNTFNRNTALSNEVLRNYGQSNVNWLNTIKSLQDLNQVFDPITVHIYENKFYSSINSQK